MPLDQWEQFDCDLCGSSEAEEIAVARRYTGGQPIHVCRGCGFVYVRRRRSAARIADDWSDELYKTKYTARIPAVKARHVFVAEFIDTTIGLKDKALCDIGGGEGQFADLIRARLTCGIFVQPDFRLIDHDFVVLGESLNCPGRLVSQVHPVFYGCLLRQLVQVHAQESVLDREGAFSTEGCRHPKNHR